MAQLSAKGVSPCQMKWMRREKQIMPVFLIIVTDKMLNVCHCLDYLCPYQAIVMCLSKGSLSSVTDSQSFFGLPQCQFICKSQMSSQNAHNDESICEEMFNVFRGEESF